MSLSSEPRGPVGTAGVADVGPDPYMRGGMTRAVNTHLPASVALGYDITVEESSSHGRLDMAVRAAGHVYLFEFTERWR